MGVLPCQFSPDIDIATLGLDGSETFDLVGIGEDVKPKQTGFLRIHSGNGVRDVPVIVRIDTPIEVEYYNNGGIVPYVLRSILTSAARQQA
jgi:aconitate hydratase